MTDEIDSSTWPTAALAAQMQEAGEQAFKQQSELFRQFLAMSSGGGLNDDYSGLADAALETATFKSRVQSGGRLSIPDAEREALHIEEGDLVQTIVIPIDREE